MRLSCGVVVFWRDAQPTVCLQYFPVIPDSAGPRNSGRHSFNSLGF